MLYCPEGVNISNIWIDHGLSQCFMTTVSDSFIASFLLVFGTIQLCMYRKYGTEISPNLLYTNSLYKFQIFLAFFVPFLEILSFILNATYLGKREVYGFMILSLLCNLFVFPYSVVLLNKERKYLLPSVPTRGHGLVLLLFWSLIFIAENLEFVNLGQENWWFHLKK